MQMRGRRRVPPDKACKGVPTARQPPCQPPRRGFLLQVVGRPSLADGEYWRPQGPRALVYIYSPWEKLYAIFSCAWLRALRRAGSRLLSVSSMGSFRSLNRGRGRSKHGVCLVFVH